MDQDFDAEVAAHIEMAVDENIRSGMSPKEARRKALAKFGSIEPARELHREARGLPALDTLLQDLRYTFRALRRDAGFTTFAILIVGLGIGASSTVFSVVNALLLRPLTFRDPGQLAGNDGHRQKAQHPHRHRDRHGLYRRAADDAAPY
jgi:hypothetical protein